MRIIFVILMMIFSVTLLADEAKDILGDEALDNKIKALSKELRCLKCQNQSIADSQSGFANQVRDVLKEKLKQGKSDRDIKNYLIERYGDFIVYEPPFSMANSLIWLTPVVVLVLGFVLLFTIIRRQNVSGAVNEEISAEQSEHINKLIEETEKAKGESP